MDLGLCELLKAKLGRVSANETPECQCGASGIILLIAMCPNCKTLRCPACVASNKRW